jgi:hypothetical protein
MPEAPIHKDSCPGTDEHDVAPASKAWCQPPVNAIPLSPRVQLPSQSQFDRCVSVDCMRRRTASLEACGPVRLVPWMGAHAQPYPDRI